MEKLDRFEPLEGITIACQNPDCEKFVKKLWPHARTEEEVDSKPTRIERCNYCDGYLGLVYAPEFEME